MKSNYRRIGDFIQLVDVRNDDLAVDTLLGLSISKQFIPSVANTVGTNMKRYKIIKKNQFACSIMQVRRDKKMPVAILKDFDKAIISQAYPVFEVKDESELLPDYLMMWFSRSEFDRQATFWAVGGVRGSLEWEDFLNFELPIPPIEEQRAIVAEYQTVTDRIQLNEQINAKLEETAQALYRHWFVDFEFPDENGMPYKSSGGKMVWNEELEKEVPEGWEVNNLIEVANIVMGQSPSGSSYNEVRNGKLFYQGRTEFSFRFPGIRTFTTEPKRIANIGDILMTVRAPVGDLNITLNECCIGRGLAAISHKEKLNNYLFYSLKEICQIFQRPSGEGTIYDSINKDALFELKILTPNNTYTRRYNNDVRQIDNCIKANSMELVELKKMVKLLLSRMADNNTIQKSIAI